MQRVITNPPVIKYDEKLERNCLRFTAFPESEPDNIFWIEADLDPTVAPLTQKERNGIKECYDILGRKVATYIIENYNP